MKTDHVTYQLPKGSLVHDNGGELRSILAGLGFHEVEAREPEGVESVGEARLQWFEDDDGFQLHLIEIPSAFSPVPLGLGHIAVNVDLETYEWAGQLECCSRNSDSSPRLWLEMINGLRIEVREPRAWNQIDGPERRRLNLLHIPPVDEGWKALFPEPGPSERAQLEILRDALRIYRGRNGEYKDNWARFGWKGCVFRMKERVERVWDGLWNRGDRELTDEAAAALMDDCLDLINFGAFTIRAIQDRNSGAEWFGD